MTKSVYQWRPRTKFDIDAQVAGEELDRIKGHNSGDLTPDMVIKAAEDTKSPLHGVFEWDDSKAAHQHRLTVAGQLIRSIVVTITPASDAAPKPINVTITPAASGGGTAAARVVSEAELHAQRVERGWADLDKWIRTYGALPEFAQVAGVVQVLSAQRPSKAA